MRACIHGRRDLGRLRLAVSLTTAILVAACGSTGATPIPKPSPSPPAVGGPVATAQPSPTPIESLAPPMTSAPSATATPSPTLTVVEAPPPQAHRAVVSPGDTLSGIAQENGLPLQVVLDANQWIVDPDLIHAGDTIEIPQVVILADFAMVPADGAQLAGRVQAVIQSPTDWPEVPGTFRFDGAPGTELRAIRGVVEQVEHWYDPAAGSGGSNVGFVLGHECQYWASRQPTCRDINWMFVDTRDPAAADYFYWCTWTDGRRPPRPADGSGWCDNHRPGSESQWFKITGGSLKVVLND